MTCSVHGDFGLHIRCSLKTPKESGSENLLDGRVRASLPKLEQ
jgi:hypothetical protein